MQKRNTNFIDSLVAECNGVTGRQKKCNNCGKSAIENSKQKCPGCKAKLPTIAKIQHEIPQTTFDKNDDKPLIIKFYDVEIGNSDKNLTQLASLKKHHHRKALRYLAC